MKNFIKRNAVWIGLGIMATLAVSPAIAEYKTIMLMILIECLALALSGLCVYAYTKLDFIKEKSTAILGQIFLGVHLCTGLSLLSIYFTMI